MEDFLKFSSGQDHERGEVPDQAETRHQQEEDPLNHKVEGVVPVLRHYLQLLVENQSLN